SHGPAAGRQTVLDPRTAFAGQILLAQTSTTSHDPAVARQIRPSQSRSAQSIAPSPSSSMRLSQSTSMGGRGPTSPGPSAGMITSAGASVAASATDVSAATSTVTAASPGASTATVTSSGASRAPGLSAGASTA